MWTMAEVQMALVLSALLRAEETDAAVAVYLVLRRSAPRFEALTAAGKVTLSERDNELLGAVLHAYQIAEAERNALAHGCFGSHPRLPDSVLWVDPSQMAHYIIDVLRRDEADSLPKSGMSLEFAKKLSHYKTKDLEEIHERIKQVRWLVYEFNIYLRTASGLSETNPLRDALYAHAIASSPIREALHDLHESEDQSRRSIPLQRHAIRRRRKGLNYKKTVD